MYNEITAEDAYQTPMRIFPAIHYTMGGLWVDYDLMSNVPGLFVLGEANFSDHGANRLGASALMQGLADGYFVIPYTIGGYLADSKLAKINPDHAACKDAEREASARIEKLLSIKGKRTVDSIHRELGLMLWNKCGMSRDETGLKELLEQIPSLREEFWRDVTVTGSAGTFNQVLERAGRVADFLEFAETMVLDALDRRESCGGHFREESQTEDGEARRDDENFSHVSAWEWQGENNAPALHKEPLEFEEVHPTQRSYK
jgi:succinate dehydrogenase / fumarate reductase flavoprotein subunit